MRTALAFLFQVFLLLGAQSAKAEERLYPATFAKIENGITVHLYSYYCDDKEIELGALFEFESSGKKYNSCWSIAEDKTLVVKVHGYTYKIDQSKIEVRWETTQVEKEEPPPTLTVELPTNG